MAIDLSVHAITDYEWPMIAFIREKRKPKRLKGSRLKLLKDRNMSKWRELVEVKRNETAGKYNSTLDPGSGDTVQAYVYYNSDGTISVPLKSGRV